MAKVHRFPVVHWKDRSGHWTSILLEQLRGGTAWSGNPQTGEQQLKRYLQKLVVDSPWMAAPSFENPKLHELKVPIRPEFQERERALACTYTVNLHLPMVLGTDNGLRVCILPTIDLRFYFQETGAKMIKELALHYVRRHLKEAPPERLARFATPEEVRLSEFVIRHRFKKKGRGNPTPELPNALKAVAEPVLASSRKRSRFPSAWERDDEVAQLQSRVAELNGGLLVIGEAGSGKTTVIAEAMRREARKTGEGAGKSVNTDYWFSAAPRIIAGMRWLGQWEQRCERIIYDLDRIGGVLWFENLLDLIKTGGRGPRDSIASFLLPYLLRNELKLIVEATPAELDTANRLLPGFAESFERVRLEPMHEDAAVRLLEATTQQLQQRHSLDTEPGVAATTQQLFHRFLPYAAFPGRATQFLRTLYAQAQDAGLDAVDPQEVLNEFIRNSGLPRNLVDDRVRLDYDEILAGFRDRIIGQDAACAAAAQLVTTFKAGMQDPRRPIGVLLFCGPTGVGKTEMSKQMAAAFFGAAESEDRLLRLDMSEYTGYGAAERLLRKPDGTPSEFVQKMRRQPFRLVLLDEVEKADPEVFDLFLRMFDEGILHDTEGRPTNFRSAVVIMTSNLGASSSTQVGFGDEAPRFESAAMSFFRPEFFNRMDAVVTFSGLRPEDVRKIAALELRLIAEREGLAERNLKLTWDEPLVAWLAERGYDRRYGARPLQRLIEEAVMTPLARALAQIPDARNESLHLQLDGDEVSVALK